LEEILSMEEAWEEESADELEEEESMENLESHPAFIEALFMHRWMDEMVESNPQIAEEAAFGRLLTRFAVCSAKLAAAISHDEEDEEALEVGMIIAFLKRSLKAAHDCLQCVETLENGGHIDGESAREARHSLFTLRNAVVDHMREMRAEWQRRYGPDS